MKKVFTRSQDVIELWAGQAQEEARCRNVYFEDKKKIYSYGSHYLLAKFITEDFRTVMINDVGYSRTTAKHIKQVTEATDGNKQFFKSKTDLDIVHKTILYNREKLKKARKPKLYTDRILYLWEKYHEYKTHMEEHGWIFFRADEYNEMEKIVKSIKYDTVEHVSHEEITEMKELQAIFAM